MSASTRVKLTSDAPLLDAVEELLEQPLPHEPPSGQALAPATGAARPTDITIILSKEPASLGKRFNLVDGKLEKTAVAHVTHGRCQSVVARSAAELVSQLRKATESKNACLVLGTWKDDTGQIFELVTEKELARQLGANPREATSGIHIFGERRVTARLKIWIEPSVWLLIDADNPPGIPAAWKAMSLAERLEFLEPIIPGISHCERVELRSSSARVVKKGELPGGPSHAFIRVSHPELIETLKARVRVEMVNHGLAFESPRHSRSEPGKVIGREHRTVVDLAPWLTGRIVFVAKPQLGAGMEDYTVNDAGITVVNEGAGVLDLSGVELPDEAALGAYRGKTGVRLKINAENGSVSTISWGELTWDTEIESRGTVKTLREWVRGMKPGDKLRCESPLRASASEAAFIKVPADGGEPFVHDVGNGTTYRLAPSADDFEDVSGEVAGEAAGGREDRTDAGNVEVLARLTGGDLRFVPESRTWLVWAGCRWVEDEHGVAAQHRALCVAEHYVAQAKKTERRAAAPHLEKADRNRLQKVADGLWAWATRCRSRKGVADMLAMAERDGRFVLPVSQLDRKPWLLGVDNGVVDLRTGTLRPDARDEFITKRSPFAYRPDAVAPRWRRFVDEVTGEPNGRRGVKARPDLAAYLQRVAGYCATGETREHKMFVMHGPGANGKSLLLDTLAVVLGPYATTIPPDALMASTRNDDGERPMPFLRRLHGARLTVSSESRHGAKLDVAVIKRHVGNATMTARGCFESPVTFDCTHKLVLQTNHAPDLDRLDGAVRSRLHMLPFDMRWNRPGLVDKPDPTLPDGDPTLADALKAEGEGILAWVVEGALAYDREGLTPPGEVLAKTSSFLDAQDSVAAFVAECERTAPEKGTAAAEVYEAYRRWCQEEGRDPVSQTAFSLTARDRLQVGAIRTARARLLGLKPPPELAGVL